MIASTRVVLLLGPCDTEHRGCMVYTLLTLNIAKCGEKKIVKGKITQTGNSQRELPSRTWII